jgi:hypothetical protein
VSVSVPPSERVFGRSRASRVNVAAEPDGGVIVVRRPASSYAYVVSAELASAAVVWLPKASVVNVFVVPPIGFGHVLSATSTATIVMPAPAKTNGSPRRRRNRSNRSGGGGL